MKQLCGKKRFDDRMMPKKNIGPEIPKSKSYKTTNNNELVYLQQNQSIGVGYPGFYNGAGSRGGGPGHKVWGQWDPGEKPRYRRLGDEVPQKLKQNEKLGRLKCFLVENLGVNE